MMRLKRFTQFGGSEVNSNGLEVVLRCDNYYNYIHLTGVSLLQEMETIEELSEREKPSV